MNITNYSVYPAKPCFLLEWPNARILLDTSVDLTPFFSFLPHVYQSQRMKNAKQFSKFDIPYLKELGNRVYVESQPEIFHISVASLKMETIDVILVSNYESFMALPCFTENTGFKGKVYVTEIAYQYGKLLMEEMLEFMSRIDCISNDLDWKNDKVCGKFPNPPFQNPVEWRPYYTRQDMYSCLTRVTTLSFNQTIDLFRIKVTPVASGHTYGSAYWTMITENEKFAYFPAANGSSTDVKPLDLTPMKSCDYILVASMSKLVDTSASIMGKTLMTTITETLKSNGSVLLPISPVGAIFEIIEAVSDTISATNGISIDTPIYLISPIAKAAIAMASISAEWMSETRQNMVYRPEEPFAHSKLIKSGRLKIYDSLYGPFSKEYKTPCVIFASHPSLRIGDAAHMVEVLGNDQRNAVILTDPDLPCEDVREPFRTLPIRFINNPMDFRMDFATLQQMLKDLKPKCVLASSSYTKPLNRRPDMQIHYDKIWPIEYDESVQLAKLSRNKRKFMSVEVHPDIVKNMKFKQHPTKKLAVASVACNLSAYNDEFKLMPAKKEIAKRTFGKIDVDKLIEALRAKKMKVSREIKEEKKQDFEQMETDVKEEKKEGKVVEVATTEDTILYLNDLGVKITVKQGGKSTKITSQKSEAREKVLEVIRSLLVEDDGIVGRKNLD